MKIGIISFAHMHAQAYAHYLSEHPDVELTAVWDEDVSRGSDMAEKYTCEYYSDLHVFLQTDIEAVVICSENVKHKEHIFAAAHEKKHILCEKPIATEIEDAKEIIAVCKEEGVRLQVAYPVRFSLVIQKVKHMIQSNELGEVLAINGTNHGQMPGGWFIDKKLSGGGAAIDHIVHLMDIIRWILKDEVSTIYAELDTRFHEVDVEDCGIVTLQLESGVIVSIDPSWSRPNTFPTWGDVTLEIIGTKGNLSIDVFKQHALLYDDTNKKVQQLPWYSDMNQGLIHDFISCLKEGSSPSITGEDGLRTLEVVQAAYQSADTNQVVTLNRVIL